MKIQRVWMLAIMMILAFAANLPRVQAQVPAYPPTGGYQYPAQQAPYSQLEPQRLPSLQPFGPGAYPPQRGAPLWQPGMMTYGVQPGTWNMPAPMQGHLPVQMQAYAPGNTELASAQFTGLRAGSVPEDFSGQPCSSCGGNGCESCGGTGSALGTGGVHGPYGDSGCCTPRWYDVHVEWMFLTRDEVSRRQDFTSDLIIGNIVLSTDDLEFKEKSGMRITTAFVVGPGSNLEVSYMGTFRWNDQAQVESLTDDLYSVFSDFGAAPFSGFVETDQATLHSISYTSWLDGLELNLRNRWVSTGCRFHGSWLVGARYVRLDEDFRHDTVVVDHVDPFTAPPANRGPGEMTYIVGTRNDLIGFQIGGDLYACVFPGLLVGAQLKAGVYGNTATQQTFMEATTPSSFFAIEEHAKDQDVSLVGEANLIAVARITNRLSIRASYTLLFIDGVALAPENFNDVPPAVLAPPPLGGRTPFINQRGNVFYHGVTGGVEWIW